MLTINRAFNFLLWMLLAMSIFSCGHEGRFLNKKRQLELSHELLFGNIDKEHFEKRVNANEKIYYSPYLVYRPSIFPDDVFKKQGGMMDWKEVELDPTISPFDSNYEYLCKQELSILLDNYPLDTFPLTIPDSLKSIYSYYDASIDIANDTSFVCFMSPLLPTKNKNIYVRQSYFYFTLVDEGFKYRLKNRKFVKYRIKRKKVEKIGTIEYHFYSM